MPETLLQKAQRLGIKPEAAATATSALAPVMNEPKNETLLQKAQRLGIKPANTIPQKTVQDSIPVSNFSSADFMSSGTGLTDPAAKGSTQSIPGPEGIGGLAKNLGGAIFSSEVGFGKSLGDAAATQSSSFGGALNSISRLSEANQRLNESILKAKKQGKDVSRLEKIARDNQDYIDQNIGMKTVTPSIAKTPEQIYGEALGTAADIASFGEYGAAAKGSESGKLLSGVTQKTNILAEKAADKALLTPSQRLFKDVGMAGINAGSVSGAQGVAGAMQENKNLEDTTTAGVKSAAGGTLFGVGTSLGFKALGKIAKGIVSTLSGVPQDAMVHVLDNPEETTKAMRAFAADADHGPQVVLSEAENAFDAVKKSRDDAYRTALAAVPAEASTALSTDGVKDSFRKTLIEFGATLDDKGNISLEDVPLPEGYKSQLEEVMKKINNWKDASPLGLNKLRQNIDVYIKAGINPSSADRKFDAILTATKKNLTSYLNEKVPQIETLNNQYTVASDFIETLRNELKLGKDVMDQTKINKLLQIFNPNKQAYKELVSQLGEQSSKQLLSDVAGLIMSKWTPEGLAKYFTSIGALGGAIANPAALLALPASSPRIVGESLGAIGKIAKKKITQYTADKLLPFIAGRSAKAIQEQ